MPKTLKIKRLSILLTRQAEFFYQMSHPSKCKTIHEQRKTYIYLADRAVKKTAHPVH